MPWESRNMKQRLSSFRTQLLFTVSRNNSSALLESSALHPRRAYAVYSGWRMRRKKKGKWPWRGCSHYIRRGNLRELLRAGAWQRGRFTDLYGEEFIRLLKYTLFLGLLSECLWERKGWRQEFVKEMWKQFISKKNSVIYSNFSFILSNVNNKNTTLF